ncbi:hypothetical protein LTR37_015239 [Vermiconidia calcicola]|uniref:Uncharacterized protein n=1 Tax=Vermiconidia calcicola TaxID=1690605 RepID=A0ACC3MR81_9PEZI|nr:hypothetical protein LTR37_015239 [Vermiconidia calcicola]
MAIGRDKHQSGFGSAVVAKENHLGIEASSTTSETDSEAQIAKIKAVQRKVDIKLLAWYCFVYLIMRIHVTNITNTAIMNEETGDDIKTQLGGLSSNQWAWVISIFFYPYAAFEPASTLLLKRFKPNLWMSRIMLTWGILSMCQAAAQNYAGILAARFFLGLAEAGFYPGVLYHLSFWYPADNMALRIAFFYACGQFSGTISGLLAYGLSFMNGVAGLAGWRWLFILEGIPILLCAFYTFFYLPNFPDERARFLTTEEKNVIVDSLPKTQPKAGAKTWNKDQVKALFTDPTFPTFTMIWVCHAIGGWGVSTVLPTVIYELGLTDTAKAQLMTMPAYIFGCSCLVLIGWAIRRKKVTPWLAAIGLECIACICYILLITVHVPVARYIFVTLALSCSISIYPIIWPERIRAAHGTTAAGLAIGMTNAAAQLNGIVGPQIYQPRFGPEYKVSFSCSIGLLCGAIIAISTTWFLVAKKDRQRREEVVVMDGRGNEEVVDVENIKK